MEHLLLCEISTQGRIANSYCQTDASRENEAFITNRIRTVSNNFDFQHCGVHTSVWLEWKR